MLDLKYLTAALLCAGLAGGCLTADPEDARPPDAELTELLDRLAEVRGDDFSGREGSKVALEIERLPFRHPRHVLSLVAAAALAYDRGDALAAQRRLDRALALDPLAESAVLLRARLAAEAGNVPRARRLLEEHVELRPDSAPAREALAGVAYLDGDLETARRELELAERLGDPTARWRRAYARGLVAEAAGELDEASRLYSESRSDRPAFLPATHRWRWVSEASRADAEDAEGR